MVAGSTGGVGLIAWFGGGRILLHRLNRGGDSTVAGRLLETIAVAVHDQDMNVMGAARR